MSQVPGTFVAFALGGFVSDGQNSDELTVRAERKAATDVEVILLARPLSNATVLAMLTVVMEAVETFRKDDVACVDSLRDAMTRALTREGA